MTIAEALRDITQGITCVDWDADDNREAWKAPTGEPYLELCSGGFKSEGDCAPCLCLNKAVAVSTWRAALLEYEAKLPGVLYWRIKPELESVKIRTDRSGTGDDEETWWFVYSRLLISNKSVIRTVKRADIR